MIDDLPGTKSQLGLQAILGRYYQADSLLVSERMAERVLFRSFHIFVHGPAQLPASSKATVVNQARKWTPASPHPHCGMPKLVSRDNSPCEIQLVIALEVAAADTAAKKNGHREGFTMAIFSSLSPLSPKRPVSRHRCSPSPTADHPPPPGFQDLSCHSPTLTQTFIQTPSSTQPVSVKPSATSPPASRSSPPRSTTSRSASSASRSTASR